MTHEHSSPEAQQKAGFFMGSAGHDGSSLASATFQEGLRDTAIERAEIHIVLRCADARETSAAFNQAVANVTREYAQEGCAVFLVQEPVAGSFVTADIVESIKHVLDYKLADCAILQQNKIPIQVYLHLVTHGELVVNHDLPASLSDTLHALSRVEGAPTNCGMMKATDFAEALEKELLTVKPVLEIPNFARPWESRSIKIETLADIQKFMKAAYNHLGTISAGWVSSIEKLPSHAIVQKDRLKKALCIPEYAYVPFRFTASVHNYRDSSLIRVDANSDIPNTFIDRVFREKRKLIEASGEASRTKAQSPDFIVFHHSDVRHPRATAMRLFLDREFQAGSVFAIGSGLSAKFHRPMGRYKIVSLYLAITRFGLKDLVILGRNPVETELMDARLKNDPLVSYFIRQHGITVHKFSHEGMSLRELEQQRHIPQEFSGEPAPRFFTSEPELRLDPEGTGDVVGG